MKILIYCQHVLGIGHLFRTLELCKALVEHEVILVSGGPSLETALPVHIREERLPELFMDGQFKGLYSTDQNAALELVKAERRKRLFALVEQEAPDLFMVELYPFGRKAFRFELDPVLEGIREKRLPSCGVICSVRDILVEKKDQPKHELRAVRTLNSYFDGVLVHADAKLVKIDETFLRSDQIAIPVVYTGFVAPKPPPHARRVIRKKLGIKIDEILIVASAGGGSVGRPLLESSIEAFERLNVESPKHMRVYTGPFIAAKDFKKLQSFAGPGVSIETFASDFLSQLAAADLSISMGGYNTSMNILATKVPALVWPFPQNREQRLRAERLAQIGALKVLENNDLQPNRLAFTMQQALLQPPRCAAGIDLDGAENTAKWIQAWAAGNNQS